MTRNSERSSCRLRRRAFLTAVAGGLTGLAGCGYRPGKGDRLWEKPIRNVGELVVAGNLLVGIEEEELPDHIPTEATSVSAEFKEGGRLLLWSQKTGERRGVVEFEESIQYFTADSRNCYVVLKSGTVLSVPLSSINEKEELPAEKKQMTTLSGENGNPTMAVFDRTVYILPEEGPVVALDPGGNRRWRQWIDTGAKRMGVGPDGLVIERGDKTIEGYTLDGTKRWENRQLGTLWTDPVVAHGRVYISEPERAEGNTVVLDMESGKRKTTVGVSGSEPVLGPDRKTMYLSDDSLHKIDLRNPAVEWTVEDMRAEPVTDGDVVFTQTEDGLVELDAATGEIRWREPEIDADRILSLTENTIILESSGSSNEDVLDARYR